MLNTISEVKKNHEGTGLLIENDGYVSLDIKNNKQLCEAFDPSETANDVVKLPRPFVVHAVFQKYGIQNANGRVYPESILKREVEKYQKRIQGREAYGECYTPDAMCLTNEGWKPIADVKEGDDVITLNTETNEIEVQKVTYKTDADWNGELIRVTVAEGLGFNDTVTPNHGYPLYDEKEKFFCFASVNELMDKKNKNKYKKLFIPCSKEIFSYVSVKDLSFEPFNYNGTVHCVEVPNHTWYVRQNNIEHWTKNCNHPDSATIDLSRVCMNIVELHWENQTLVGQMEIPITEGYRKYGIISNCADQVAHWIVSGLQIGVSSRALGSVKQIGGVLVVGEDLELVAWDVVSNESTPGAKVKANKDELKPYIENTEKNGEVIKEETTDKYSKFDSWLND